MWRNAIVAIGVALLSNACSTTPFHGTYADVPLGEATRAEAYGKEVLWGGVVFGTRLTDAGDCVEIGQFPIDRFSGRPQAISLDANRMNLTERRAPRFLACGPQAGTGDYREGARVTVVGTLARAQTFTMAESSCQERQDTVVHYGSRYATTPHLLLGGACVVALPTLQIREARIWKERPSQFTTAQTWATNG